MLIPANNQICSRVEEEAGVGLYPLLNQFCDVMIDISFKKQSNKMQQIFLLLLHTPPCFPSCLFTCRVEPPAEFNSSVWRTLQPTVRCDFSLPVHFHTCAVQSQGCQQQSGVRCVRLLSKKMQCIICILSHRLLFT